MTHDLKGATLQDHGSGDEPSVAASRFMKWPESQDYDCSAELLDLGSRLLRLSASSAAEFVRQASALISSTLPGWGTFRLPRMCEIPETKCPPKSLGTIYWKGWHGETLTQLIRVTNTSDDAQIFTLSTAPFAGPGGATAPIQLATPWLTLAGGATGSTDASMTIPDKFPEGRYQTKIMLTGAYEQHIDVVLVVSSPQQSTLDVSLGDIPTHIKAHRWYHHFQCVEPCFPPAMRRLPDESVPGRKEREPGKKL